MNEINEGDTVIVTDKVLSSEVYPFVREGAEGVVLSINPMPRDPYPYQIQFAGDHVVDPHGCPTIVRNPTLLFGLDEITLKGTE
jgi:hypothetical protein